MTVESAVVHFIRQNASKGRKWISEHIDLTPSEVSVLACQHRISLRREGETRGRKMNPKSRAQRRAENRDIRDLPMEHPKVQMIYASRSPDPKDRLRTHKWKKQRKKVLDRDAHTCVYCGDQATSVDHVIPRVAGGDDSLDNLVSSCTRCNSRKGSMSGAIFLGRRLTPPVFADNLSAKQSKPVRNGHTQSKILRDSPFTLESDPDQSGAS